MLQIAAVAAKLSDHHYRIGAVVAKGIRIIGLGCNKKKTHPDQINPYTGRFGESIHAERAAIINAGTDLIGTTIYVARILKDGNVAMARPCRTCFDLLRDKEVKYVVYTTVKHSFNKEKL